MAYARPPTHPTRWYRRCWCRTKRSNVRTRASASWRTQRQPRRRRATRAFWLGYATAFSESARLAVQCLPCDQPRACRPLGTPERRSRSHGALEDKGGDEQDDQDDVDEGDLGFDGGGGDGEDV